MRLSSTNEPLARALYLYGAVGYDWRGLYLVLDAIKDGNGGKGVVDTKEFAKPYKKNVKLFERISGSFKKLGLESRHAMKKGYEEYEPEDEMTVGEAQKLFSDLLKAWIKEIQAQENR